MPSDNFNLHTMQYPIGLICLFIKKTLNQNINFINTSNMKRYGVYCIYRLKLRYYAFMMIWLMTDTDATSRDQSDSRAAKTHMLSWGTSLYAAHVLLSLTWVCLPNFNLQLR